MGKLSQVIDEDEGPLATINIIPFVDIALVLLVIFMLTSATIARASLQIELPRAASAGSKVQSTINLVLTRDHEIFFDGQPVGSLAEAARLVQAEADADPKTQAVIAADRGAEYGRVFELIDVVKQAGITTFALDVERAVPPAAGAP